ncbi:MAG: metallo-beta-lactamase [Paenibacillaceae bacterium]|jgi:beta-lactamase superfamily II metal-dependent hydrolase|nr:metallo-beta-lactamase [Paenibacillaceae bacterium]
MKLLAWKRARAYIAAAALVSTLALTACTNIEMDTKEAAAPPDTSVERLDGVKTDTPMRTAEVFDKDKYKGMMTIRYLYLTGDTAMGDAIVIQSPDGKTMMIDSGSAGAGSQVVKHLKNLGIDKIDVALNTHPHSDHIGGFYSVANAMPIGQFYMENLELPSKSYSNSISALKRKNVPITYLEEGSTFKLGDEITAEVLSPKKGDLPDKVLKAKDATTDSDAAIVNYYALVVKMTYKNNTFLFSGDIYTNREEELIKQYGDKLNVDLAHGNHHGWTTSNGNPWITATSPQIALVSNNIFRNLDVMKRYDNHKTKIFTTRFNGTILVTSDGNKLTAIPERNTSNLPPGFLKNQ